MNHFIEYQKNIKFPLKAKQFKLVKGICDACGATAKFEYANVINDRLAKEWGISKKLQKEYSIRESMHCSSCRCSARLRALAKSITLVYDPTSISLKDSIKNGIYNNKKIAEINACGDLHKILFEIPRLSYSEYAPREPSIKNEDLQSLSYKSGSFDVVLTSDTLEHVPDYMLALKEIRRVLKPGGYHIFTIPLIFSRSTRRRIIVKNGKTELTMPASYHGAGEADNLVSTEFGIDFLQQLKKAGFMTDIYFANPFRRNEANFVLVSRKAVK